MGDLIGQSIGRYHILEQLGEGGMATVYKAYDMRLEANVAIKFIRTDKLGHQTDSMIRQRFEREARLLAHLTHPNIVKIIDYGEYRTQPYLVMPYLSGGTLKQMLTGTPMPYQTAAKILLPVARALYSAHQQGMIHRDVKPSNILLTDSGEPMLSDFGVAKILEEDGTTAELTATGVGIGTPEYMAPEQAEKTIDHRADIYSLGTVLYEMITGCKPYRADTPLAVLIKRASEPLPRPKKLVPNLPDKVEQVLLKALARNPSDRYATADEFANELEKLAILSEPGIVVSSYLKVFLSASAILIVLIGCAGLLAAYQFGYFSPQIPLPLKTQTSPPTIPIPKPTLSKTSPVVLVSTNTSSVIPSITLPSPTMEPQFNPDDPEGFLMWYFHSLWADRNYEVLWDYVSIELRDRLNVDYSDYAANWEKIGSIKEPIAITFVRREGDILVYRVEYTTLSRKSGIEDHRNDGYYLLYNSSKGHWELK